jgi:glyoxylase-like metal-dependent hydrolase (beta-lactamase superfamily II)
MIIESITVGMFQENCYLVGDESTGEGAILDPGDEAERILSRATQTGLTFRYILNTHAHLDHVCAVQAVKDALGIPFLLHPDDEVLLQHLPQQAAMFGLTVGKAPSVDQTFHDDGLIRLGSLTVRVLHTPGHSPGGVSFYFESEKVLFAGDTLFNGSIGRTDLYGGDFETLIRSIRSRILTLPDEVVVYPGHGPETSVGHERRFNPFLQGSRGEFYA